MKKLATRIGAAALVVCMVMSMALSAFAATKYYLELSISGRNVKGEAVTVTATGPSISLNASLAVEVASIVANNSTDAQKAIHEGHGNSTPCTTACALYQMWSVELDRVFDAGEIEFGKDNDAAWLAWVNQFDQSRSDAEMVTWLKDLDTTVGESLGDKLGVPYTLYYEDIYDVRGDYVVTIKLVGKNVAPVVTPPSGDDDDDEPVTPPSGDEKTFVDIDGHWAKDAIIYVAEKGLFAGTGDGTTFSPEVELTRAMMAQVIYNMEGAESHDYVHGFTDVPNGMWYTKAINWAAREDVVAGYGDFSYKPDKILSREEVVQIFYNYAKAKGFDISQRADLTGYADHTDIAGWARVALEWGVGSGLVSGKGGGIIDPQANTTRAEAAQMFKNFLQYIAE